MAFGQKFRSYNYTNHPFPYKSICNCHSPYELHDERSGLRNAWNTEKVAKWAGKFECFLILVSCVKYYNSRSLEPYRVPPDAGLCPHIVRLPGDICVNCQRSRSRMLKTLRPLITFVERRYEDYSGRSKGVCTALKFSGEREPIWVVLARF